jgi:hypothetical protein
MGCKSGGVSTAASAAVDQLPSALMLPADQFTATYNFRKPTSDDLLIMSSEWAGTATFVHRGLQYGKSLAASPSSIKPFCSTTRARAKLKNAGPLAPLSTSLRLLPNVCPCAGRTNNRSAWAAQVAKDAGLQRCLVHRQGVYGWHFEPSVLPYRRYSMLDPPPDPEPFQVEEVDAEAGQLQLAQLGLL